MSDARWPTNWEKNRLHVGAVVADDMDARERLCGGGAAAAKQLKKTLWVVDFGRSDFWAIPTFHVIFFSDFLDFLGVF